MVNVIHDRAKFYQRMHLPDEIVETYIRALHKAGELCDYKRQKVEQLKQPAPRRDIK